VADKSLKSRGSLNKASTVIEGILQAQEKALIAFLA